MKILVDRRLDPVVPPAFHRVITCTGCRSELELELADLRAKFYRSLLNVSSSFDAFVICPVCAAEERLFLLSAEGKVVGGEEIMSWLNWTDMLAGRPSALLPEAY